MTDPAVKTDAGHALSGVPAGATAVAFTATTTNVTKGGYLGFDTPTGTEPARTSFINLIRGLDAPNLVIAPIAPDGQITIYNRLGSVDVILDTVGYFVPGTP